MQPGEHKRFDINDAAKSTHHHPAQGPADAHAPREPGAKPFPTRTVATSLALVAIVALAAWQFLGRSPDKPTPEQVEAEQRQQQMVQGRAITPETPPAEGPPSRAAQPAPPGVR
jgi:hypothetical protein